MKKRPKRVCPLLEKYYISNQDTDWTKKVCLNCIVSPICVLELTTVPPILNKTLRNTMLPCPKCQDDPMFFKEIMGGARISGLIKNEYGDWACFICGYILYRPPFLKKAGRGKTRRILKNGY